ncbi:MAG: hypothetical protein CL489_08810 [Acidobacteria bacterium]|nr:hypothetical protein [Acidobacteriota bacterium]|tara:strand:- start:5069 stop:5284 length:216 start_codon:yes stop_codon:yes gene_type:complete
MGNIKYRMYLKDDNGYIEGDDIGDMIKKANEMGYRASNFDFEIIITVHKPIDYVDIKTTIMPENISFETIS